jgi:VanZ family protein
MSTNTNQMRAQVALPGLVIVLILAFTAVPIELQPLTRQRVAEAFQMGLDVPDILANIVGYVPLGLVFASRGPWTTVALSGGISLLAEMSQLFSASRSPRVLDIATNVLGAVIGLVIVRCLRPEWRNRPRRLLVNRRRAVLAATLALGYLAFGVRLTPLQVEGILRRVAKTPRLLWLEESRRGATESGRLEASWTFDDVSGDTAVDVSGNGLNGRLVNAPTLTDGIDGQSLTLNGTNQYVDVGDPRALRLAGSETISAWIKSSSFPVDDAAVVSDHNGFGYQLDTTADRGPRTIGFKLANASGRLMARYGRTPLDLDTWYHIAGVYDAQAQTLNVYLNGRNDNGCLLGMVTSRQRASGMKAYIGRRADLTGFEFAGSIDDVRIYSRALTQREIEANFKAAPEAPSIPVLTDAVSDRGDELCPSHEVSDSRTSGLVVTFGVLVAVALLGFFPAISRQALCLACLAAGLVLVPTLYLAMPAVFKWLLPLLSLAGGSSVAFSTRPRRNIT